MEGAARCRSMYQRLTCPLEGSSWRGRGLGQCQGDLLQRPVEGVRIKELWKKRQKEWVRNQKYQVRLNGSLRAVYFRSSMEGWESSERAGDEKRMNEPNAGDRGKLKVRSKQ